MKLEEIIPLLGNLGRYQLFAIGYMCLVSILACFHTLGNVFFAAEADHWCRLLPDEDCSAWPEFQHNCTAAKKAILLPPPERNDSKYPYSNCNQWQVPAGDQFDPYEPLSQAGNFTAYVPVPCPDGWEYDTSQYQTTTITDVSPLSSLPFQVVTDEPN